MNRAFVYAGENADLLIMGNSRAMHYDEAILSEALGMKCRNIGWTGFPFIYQYHGMFRTYMNRNHPPRYIIQEITPQLFFKQLKSPYIMETLPRINEPEYKFFADMCPEITFADRFILKRYAGKIGEVVKQLKTLLKAQQKEPLPTVYNSDPDNVGLRTGTKSKIDDNQESIDLFMDYLKECREKGIKMVLVCSPMHKRDALDHIDMNSFWVLISKLIQEQDVSILDYENYFDSDSTYFYDPMHMNQHGINIYSYKIAHDLDSLGIIPAHHHQL
jgi:hypothetical protein